MSVDSLSVGAKERELTTPQRPSPLLPPVLQENKFWEDSFQVYERGVALFKYPHVKEIWQAYLEHFVER